jgi:tetratricopeptide (TPR) repeat protein
MSEAVSLLTEAIAAAPTRPSCYNNRAQVLRLKGNPESALGDLDQAIKLSGGVGRTSAQALVQRGLIHRKDGRDDDATADFKAAAALGSAFAKSVLVQMNPYAAMCNKMLKNVFGALEMGDENVVNPFKDVAAADARQG